MLHSASFLTFLVEKQTMPGHSAESHPRSFQFNNRPPSCDFPGIKKFPPENPNISRDVRECYQHNQDQTRLKLMSPLGQWTNSDVYAAELIFFTDGPGVLSWPCAAKRLKNYHDENIPREFLLHQEMTRSAHEHGLSSVESGVLTMIGIHAHTNANGKKTYWGIYPKCDAVLESWKKPISALQHTNTNLFCHLVYTVFQGFVRGLTTFTNAGIFYADPKPQNTFFRNSGFGFLDLGASKTKDEFTQGDLWSGSPCYMAPEVIATEGFTPFAADVFGCGQMLRELLGSEVLFKTPTAIESINLAGDTYKKMRNANPIDSTNLDLVQIRLINELNTAVSFVDCLTIITNAMCEILPENRPTLETLKYANERLLHFKQGVAIENSEISAWYADLICNNGTGTNFRQTAGESSIEESDSFVHSEIQAVGSSPSNQHNTTPPATPRRQERHAYAGASSPASSVEMSSERPSPARLSFWEMNQHARERELSSSVAPTGFSFGDVNTAHTL